ncbi:hypothetical protein LR48_Vigan02g081200 [Vigna angularis]|uniref:Uncharacterized protein n=1 Tax=Phaseolus angularis TaxID=3914 RepID=A0A0L9TW79_PHAAN|nr:hypothetical protein LR48_Vigan02g081200 [Vigna angularis]
MSFYTSLYLSHGEVELHSKVKSDLPFFGENTSALSYLTWEKRIEELHSFLVRHGKYHILSLCISRLVGHASEWWNQRQPKVEKELRLDLKILSLNPLGFVRNWDELEEEFSCQEVGTHKGQKEHQKKRLQKVALKLGRPFHDPQRWSLAIMPGRPFWGAERPPLDAERHSSRKHA